MRLARSFACALGSAVLVALLAGLAGPVDATQPASPPRFKAGAFEPPRTAPDFSLTGADGQTVQLSRLRGKVVLMSFGFASCPAVCPITLATLAEAKRSLGAGGDAVQVLFVTVDPERDDAARLKAWVTTFDPTFLGVTGDPAALAAVRRSYGVVANKVPTSSGYSMDHSSSIFLIDRQGRLRGQMPYGRDAKDFAHDVRLLLAS